MNKALTDDEIEELNKQEQERAAREYEDFRRDLRAGKCYICELPLTSFDETRPCLHWLLRPAGFRKKHFKKLFDTFTYDRIESYLRWYVNAHEPFKNINDLKEEHEGDKVKALTIKHDNLEWSFDFSKNCVEGKHGDHGPHYHFQMRVDGHPLHNYGNRHIRLSDYEVWLLDVEQGKVPKLHKGQLYGMGMQATVENIDPEALLNAMRSTDDIDNAAFQVHSLVEADEGQLISGDEIADMYEESKRTGVPIHRLIHKLKGAKKRVIIEPGPGVPIALQRTPVRPGSKKKRGTS